MGGVFSPRLKLIVTVEQIRKRNNYLDSHFRVGSHRKYHRIGRTKEGNLVGLSRAIIIIILMM